MGASTYILVTAAFLILQLLMSQGKLSSTMKGFLVPACAYIVLAISLNLLVGICGELSGRSPQRLVGESLNQHAKQSTHRHGRQNGYHNRQPQIVGDAEGNVRAHHDHIAMGKVQHLGNAVDHGVAKGNDGVDRADADAVDQVLNNFHDCPPLSSFLGSSG